MYYVCLLLVRGVAFGYTADMGGSTVVGTNISLVTNIVIDFCLAPVLADDVCTTWYKSAILRMHEAFSTRCR